MSILKSILHHYNKVTQGYDTLHPETESAQITDWHSGIMASLASKTLGTVVDAITTDSVLGKLIKMLLNASGVKYLIDTNGYICFGEYFGGLIIQWGTATTTVNNGVSVTLPIAFNKQIMAITGIPVSIARNGTLNEYGWQIVTSYLYLDGQHNVFGLWTCNTNNVSTSALVRWTAKGV